VGVARLGQPEQALEQDLARRRVQEVGPPNHLAHTLCRVVHHDGELVGWSAVVAPHDEIVHMPLAISEQAVLKAYADALRPQPQGGRLEASFSVRSFALSSRQVPGYRSEAEIPCGAETVAWISARVQ
jgi:hypothetical protein